MTAYTSNKRYAVQTSGEHPGTWGIGGTNGDDLNTGVMLLLDGQLAGVATFSVSSSNITLSYANVQTCMYRFTGTLLANIVVSPDGSGSPVAANYFNGFYYFENLTSGSFTITVTTGIGSVVLPQSRRGILFIDNVNGPRIVSIVGSDSADPIPVSTNMLFYQAAAPSGWTLITAFNDYAMKLVSSGGGVTVGSVPYSTLFGRTATDPFALTTTEMPLHYHVVQSAGARHGTSGVNAGTTFYASDGDVTSSGATLQSMQSSNAGSGGGHSHGINMQVLTAFVILASKN